MAEEINLTGERDEKFNEFLSKFINEAGRQDKVRSDDIKALGFKVVTSIGTALSKGFQTITVPDRFKFLSDLASAVEGNATSAEQLEVLIKLRDIAEEQAETMEKLGINQKEQTRKLQNNINELSKEVAQGNADMLRASGFGVRETKDGKGESKVEIMNIFEKIKEQSKVNKEERLIQKEQREINRERFKFQYGLKDLTAEERKNLQDRQIALEGRKEASAGQAASFGGKSRYGAATRGTAGRLPGILGEMVDSFIGTMMAPVRAFKSVMGGITNVFKGIMPAFKMFGRFLVLIVGAIGRLLLPFIAVGAALGLLYLAIKKIGKFLGFGKSDEEKKAEDDKARMEGTGKYQSLDEGTFDAIDSMTQDAPTDGRDSKDPKAPFYDKNSKQIIQPDNPDYDEIRAKAFPNLPKVKSGEKTPMEKFIAPEETDGEGNIIPMKKPIGDEGIIASPNELDPFDKLSIFGEDKKAKMKELGDETKKFMDGTAMPIINNIFKTDNVSQVNQGKTSTVIKSSVRKEDDLIGI